jgi:hypothetical protein
MSLSLLPNESIIWEGRYVYPLRFPIATVVSLFAVAGLAALGIAGAIVAFFIFLCFLFFLFVSLWELRKRAIHYYVTNLRVARKHGYSWGLDREMHLDQVEAVVVKHYFLSQVRGIGSVYFDGVVFERIRDSNHVMELIQDAKSRFLSVQPPQQSSGAAIREIIRERVLVQCRYCGARAEQGTLRCPKCGANL